MNDLNIVAIVGRLTRDCEVKEGNYFCCRFSIAVNRRKKNGDQWEDEASFFDCVYFGKAAEAVSQYLVKGRQVSITGELHQSRWTDQEGQAHSKIDITVSNLALLGGRNEEEAPRSDYQSSYKSDYQPVYKQEYVRPAQPYKPTTKRSTQSSQLEGPELFKDEEIPF